ncbi:hypothetical protein [Mesorhizobium sp.]|uniref:hypothetical protein n=1 Tax=Mesorhizobium sp. TaxID=1871066 RepID=UPI0012296EA2|nr:hypothetical protein [Mesorhizobium sp.]TIN84321.1 MAG: hypothetical protein E5X97_22370 [Mesorhizobium sp.]
MATERKAKPPSVGQLRDRITDLECKLSHVEGQRATAENEAAGTRRKLHAANVTIRTLIRLLADDGLKIDLLVQQAMRHTPDDEIPF